MSGGGGAPSHVDAPSALPVAANRRGRWGAGGRGEAFGSPALVRENLSPLRTHGFLLWFLLCALVLFVGLACFACCVLGRLSAIEGRLSAVEASDERVDLLALALYV